MLDLKNIYEDVINEVQSMSDAEFFNEILGVKLSFYDSYCDPLSTYHIDTLTGSPRNTDSKDNLMKYPDAGVLAA